MPMTFPRDSAHPVSSGPAPGVEEGVVSDRFPVLRQALRDDDSMAARVALAEVEPVEDALDELAARARDGSQAAVELLIETLDETGVVRAFAGAALLDAAAVDDVSQDALISVAESIHRLDRKSTRLNSSHVAISYAVFCRKKKNRR